MLTCFAVSFSAFGLDDITEFKKGKSNAKGRAFNITYLSTFHETGNVFSIPTLSQI